MQSQAFSDHSQSVAMQCEITFFENSSSNICMVHKMLLSLQCRSLFLSGWRAVLNILPMTKLYFNTRDELNRIEVSKIVYFEADGNYTTVVMVNKLRAAIYMNLGEMEKALVEQLGPEDKTFMRIGKRFIINMQYIYQINVLKQQLILSDYDHFAFQISISKDALRKVKDLMLQTRI